MKPTLSIVTPVKNAAEWLADCLESGLNQSFTDWEWILIDDHSEDSSAEIIKSFSDHRIRVFKNPEKGIIPALQSALDKCRGTFITRMDADDIMPRERLQKTVGAMVAAPPKTIVTGMVRYFGQGGVSEGYLNYESWLNDNLQSENPWKNLYRECLVASPNWMMPMSELRATGGFEGLEYPEDYDLVFRWYKNRFSLKTLDETTLLWREHPKRTSRNSDHYSQRKFFELKLRKFAELELYGAPLVLWGSGRKARLAAHILHNMNIDFSWMDVKPERFPKGIQGHQISHYMHIERFENPKLLLAIYPPTGEMQKLKSYLSGAGLSEGSSYWFL